MEEEAGDQKGEEGGRGRAHLLGKRSGEQLRDKSRIDRDTQNLPT